MITQEHGLYKEWLLTNGLGGFTSLSLSSTPMRKYHGLLVSALHAPLGRTMMLNFVQDTLIKDKEKFNLSYLRLKEDKLDVNLSLLSFLDFRLENGLPIWIYKIGPHVIEKAIYLVHSQNTVHISYKLLEGTEEIILHWRPYIHFRSIQQEVNSHIEENTYSILSCDHGLEIQKEPFLNLKLISNPPLSFIEEGLTAKDVFYEMEYNRGYASLETLYSPGYFSCSLTKNTPVIFTASTENWETLLALPPDLAHRAELLRRKNLLKVSHPRNSAEKFLTLAADQFIITPISRFVDLIRLKAEGEEAKTIIAGYPWFLDWGRDTMISLEGLTLSTERDQVAHAILRTFAFYVKDGLIPNMFPEGKNEGLYHTVDATLWFFHAIDRYLEKTKDFEILEIFLPILKNIIQHHVSGTRFGIKMDTDGLLMHGQEGYQLTWMDAKVDDWVVTPRRGKAVEINSLWYNALKLYENWSGQSLGFTEKCYHSFNEKFWYAEGGYLYDVIEGETLHDPSLRPNQLFSISLKYPVLMFDRWKSVLTAIQKDLLTPYGLRTLAPHAVDYKPYYHGDLYARDAAYHQGTVWPWLIGPYVDVWLKIYPDDYEGVRKLLQKLLDHLDSTCIGTLSEIFDASDPYHARGCFAQAWSVAEVLRCLKKLP